jgi:hypothetical protein
MLSSARDLDKFAIGAPVDGIGQVNDRYFDDQAGAIHHLFVETGAGLFRRKVRISPLAIGQPDWTDKILPTAEYSLHQGDGHR